jgi:hypothetical protein
VFIRVRCGGPGVARGLLCFMFSPLLDIADATNNYEIAGARESVHAQKNSK